MTNLNGNMTNSQTLNGSVSSSQTLSGSVSNMQTSGGGTTNYRDLKNKPSINNVELLDNKTLDDLGIQPKGNYATETFVTNKITEAQLGGEGGDIDLSGYATKDELNNKVDKVNGKSLILDTEIERLSKVTNYDDTEIKALIDAKASTSAIPTKVSQLTNDKNYISSIPDEYVTETELNNKGYLTSIPDNYVTETELNNKNYISSIPDNYVTEEDLNNKGYLTSIPSEYITDTELTGKKYATETYVNEKIAGIDPSGGGGSSETVYSLEEKRIGTWINGKPLYRKVFYSADTIRNGDGYKPNTSIAGIDIIANVDITIGAAGSVCSKGYWTSGSYTISTQYNKTDGLYIRSNYEGFAGWSVIVEYTKTTD